MGTPIDMGPAPVPDRHTLRLMAWLSPSFPVGAFSYSHGLEWAVEDGTIGDRDSLETWIRHLLDHGSGKTDAVILRAAYEAVQNADAERFADAAAWADAFRATPELALESNAQGAAFFNTVAAAWSDLDLAPWRAVLAAADRPAAYAVSVGTVGALAGVPLASLIGAYLHAFAANLISAGVRLVPLGQTDGQRATAALETAALDIATNIASRPEISLPDDLGSAAPLAELASMHHETQYTRLFRS